MIFRECLVIILMTLQPKYRTLLFVYFFLLLTPLIQDFIPRLKDFVLCKILNQEYDFDEVFFTEAERASVTFVKNKIYQHKVMHVNYTTYDMRREQDSLNPRTHANIMVLSQEREPDAHPYWYNRHMPHPCSTRELTGSYPHRVSLYSLVWS